MSHKNGKYVKATGLYTIGNIFNRAISLLLLPIFTRLLSTSSYGIVNTYNSWVTIATVIVGMQLYLTLRSAVTDYRDNLNEYISSITFLILISFIVVLSITTVGFSFFSDSIPLILVVLCIIHAFMHSLINIELQREMMAYEYVKRTLLLILPNLIAAIAGIVIIKTFPDTKYMGRIGSNVAVYILFGIVFLFYNFRKGKVYYDKEIWKYGLALSTPLIFHGIASDILSSVDRTMITSYRSASETGIYGVAYTLGMAIKVITSSVESVWIPWFTKAMNDGKKEVVNKIARKYLLIVSCLCIAAMMCLPEVLKLFAESSYWSGIYIIPPIVLASFITFLYSISVDVEYYYKATKGIAINTIIAAFTNLVLNFIFIPKYGAIAAAYTTVVSYAVSFLIHYFTSRKLDKELFPFKFYILPIGLSIIGTATTHIFIDNYILRWACAIFIMIIAIIIILRNKNSLPIKIGRKE